jgi:S1-C subfamily serine protease
MDSPQDEPTLPPDGRPTARRHRWSAPLARLRTRARLRSRVRQTAPFASGIAAALIAVLIYGAMNPGPKPLTQQDINQSVTKALASQTPLPPAALAVYRAVAPSVVQVIVLATALPTFPPLPGTESGPTPSAAPSVKPSAAASPSLGTPVADGSTGSGVIINANGDIMTCLHVIHNATAIQVVFADGSASAAKVQSTDATRDIAILTPTNPPGKIVPAVLGSSRSMQVGSDAYIISYPFGMSGTLTAGVVSALNRSLQLPNDGPNLQGLIQFDAAVNPGSSGGPLLNRNGQVVGIVEALVNPTNQDTFIGIGLAMPIEAAGAGSGLPPD